MKVVFRVVGAIWLLLSLGGHAEASSRPRIDPFPGMHLGRDSDD